MGIEKVSLNAIAKRAGLAKSNVYRYFDTREAIFLELVYADYGDMARALSEGLVPLAGSNDLEGVADLITDVYVARPRLCQLTAVLASVLEQTPSEETILEFKTRLLELGRNLLFAVYAAAPRIALEDWVGLITTTHGLVAGLWPMAHPSEATARVLARPEFAVYHTSFEVSLRKALRAILKGTAGEVT